MSVAKVYFIVAGDLDLPTGGNIYDRRIVEALRGQGWEVAVVSLTGQFPNASEKAVRQAARLFERLADGSALVIDGLVLADLSELVQRHRGRVRILSIIHYALAHAKGLPHPLRQRLCAQERAGRAALARIVVTSDYMARALAGDGVHPDRIGIVVPGADPAPASRGSGAATATLLCVASVTEHKGYHILVRALATLKELAWRLVCVGSLTREPATVAALEREITALGLAARIKLTDEIPHERLGSVYDRADVFVLASFHEAYGMALSEALVRGLPIVSTTAGAIPETVPPSAGLLVAPGDAAALAGALRRVIVDRTLRSRLAAGARRAGRDLHGWEAAGVQFAAEVRRVFAP